MSAAGPPVPLPDPHLADPPVLLRPWIAADAPALAAAWADEEVARWTGVPARRSLADARRWISGDADRRARGLSLDLVVDVEGGVAGEVGLWAIDPRSRRAEIGWWIAPDHRGQGLAGRAARLLSEWALAELNLDEVLARCDLRNPPSSKVALAAGFSPAGTRGDVAIWRSC